MHLVTSPLHTHTHTHVHNFYLHKRENINKCHLFKHALLLLQVMWSCWDVTTCGATWWRDTSEMDAVFLTPVNSRHHLHLVTSADSGTCSTMHRTTGTRWRVLGHLVVCWWSSGLCLLFSMPGSVWDFHLTWHRLSVTCLWPTSLMYIFCNTSLALFLWSSPSESFFCLCVSDVGCLQHLFDPTSLMLAVCNMSLALFLWYRLSVTCAWPCFSDVGCLQRIFGPVYLMLAVCMSLPCFTDVGCL